MSVTVSPLHVLHVTKRFWPFHGGVERYVEDVAVAQADRGDRVTVLTIDRDLVGGSDSRLAADDLHRGVRVVRVPAIGTSKKQVPAGSIRRIVQELRRADVVHQHDPRFLFETAIAVRTMVSRPLILHTHGFIWHTGDYAMLKSLALRYYYGPALRRFTSAIVASSATDLDLLRETAGVTGRRVNLIPNAVDLHRHLNISRRPEPGHLLVFGRIDTHKGFDRLFKALSLVEGRWRLSVVGSGSDLAVGAAKAAARDVGVESRVAWLGEVSSSALDMALSRATVAIFPSRFEAFGLALLEALAAGVPVLASDIEAHREVIGADLSMRLVVDMDDPEATARAISRALERSDDEAAEVTREERVRARAFDFDRHLLRLDELYRALGLQRIAS